MSSFEPSKYQKAILDYIENETGNLLVDAKAGAGKTSTLILIADKIIEQNKKCLFLAFNKSIVEELKGRIVSDNCQVKTLHSLGLSFLRSYMFRLHKENYELQIDQNDEFIKNSATALFDKYCLEMFKISNSEVSEDEFKDLYYNVTREIASLVNYCRLYNVNYHEPEQVFDVGNKLCWYLPKCHELGIANYPRIVEEIIDTIKNRFANPLQNSEGKYLYTIGYTDMIYFPCLYKMYVPFALRSYLDFVLLDEVQDLSVLQQLFVKLLMNDKNRLIAVGDENQSIYAFAGADTKSITNLKKNFQLKQLPLNICYRCPEKVIKLAQSIVPDIDYNHNREDAGEVTFIDEKDLVSKVKAGDVILARRNNDLVRLYKKLVLDEKVSVKFKNIDMVNTIDTEINRIIKDYIKKYNSYLNVEKELYAICDSKGIAWQKDNKYLAKPDIDFINKKGNELVKERKKKGKAISKSNYTIDYLAMCMKEYKEEGAYNYTIEGDKTNIHTEYFDVIESLLEKFKESSLGIKLKDFEVYVQRFLKGNLEKNVPVLSSIHMMKGGEADNVFILDYPRFPYIYSQQAEDVQQQERNLQYVALTRPKKKLYLINIARCKSRETEEDIEKLNTRAYIEVNQMINKTTLL